MDVRTIDRVSWGVACAVFVIAVSCLGVAKTSAAATPETPASWGIAYGGADSSLSSVSYDGVAVQKWTVSSALGHSDWLFMFPPLVQGATYKFSARVAGTGQVALNVWDGNENVQAPVVQLTPTLQTITEIVKVLAPNSVVVSPSAPQLQLVDVAGKSGTSAVTAYVADPSWVRVSPRPVAPDNVEMHKLSKGGLRLAWSPSQPCVAGGVEQPTVTGYEVYVSARPFFETRNWLASHGPAAFTSVLGCDDMSVVLSRLQLLLLGPAGPSGYFSAVAATGSDGDSELSAEVSTTHRRGSTAAHAQAAVQELQAYYNGATGLYDTMGWWNTANGINAVVNYMRRTRSRAYMADLGASFEQAASPRAGEFIDSATDDTEWWALTWLNAYRLTHRRRYLQTAEVSFTHVASLWTPNWCGGGLPDSSGSPSDYHNAVSNELFLKLAARLYLATHDKKYLAWAERELTWFNGSGMINASGLVNDGLTANGSGSICVNNDLPTWTYNQGIILGGLVALFNATNNYTYLAEANGIARATIEHLSSANDILTEPCSGTCASQNPNMTQFKGVFMRDLYDLYRVTRDPRYATFIVRNARSIWRNDRKPSDRIGFDWSGPVDGADQSFNASTLSSALDALNAAASVRRSAGP